MRSDLFWRGHRAEPGHHGARAIDEELLEVPCDRIVVGGTWLLAAQPFVQVACTVAIDLDLGEHREVRVVLRRGELEDLGVGAGFLRPELVTRKSENGETALGEIGLKSTQTCVLRSKASKTRDVDDEGDLVAVPAQ